VSKPLIAEKNLDFIQEHVLSCANSNANVSIFSFRGSGVPFMIKQALSQFPSSRIFTWLDLDQILASNIFASSLETLNSNYAQKLNSASRNIIESLMAQNDLNEAQYLGFIKYLITDENKELTIIIRGVGNLYQPSFDSQRTIVHNLCRISLDKLSLIFLSAREMDEKDKTTLGPLYGYISANQIWGGAFLFDRKSADIQLQDKDFTKEFKSKLARFIGSDPTLYKYCEVRAQRDVSFQRDFVKVNDIKEMYNIIGANWLDWRYYEIVTELKLESVRQLKDGIPLTSEFCIQTGIGRNTDKGIGYFHPLFEYFIINRFDQTKVMVAELSPENYLTGQELKVFRLLEKEKPNVVSRDSIAKIMWDEAWNDKYSDWSIDKVISNTKRKLFEHSEKFTIKTYKGQGFGLIKFD